VKTHLMILGDVRVGDCFHIGVYLKSLKHEYETIWVHGTYERDAVHFMRDHCDLGIVRTIEKPSLCLSASPSTIPLDLNSINAFIKKYAELESIKSIPCDLYTDTFSPLYFVPGMDVIYDTKNLLDYQHDKDYIMIHCSSISSWKNIQVLENLPLGITVYGIGPKNEKIPRNAMDMRGAMMEEIASMMKGAKCVVGIHSAMACLAFHIDVPLVTCFFWDGTNQLKFGDFRDGCIDLVYPTQETVMDAIRSFGGY